MTILRILIITLFVRHTFCLDEAICHDKETNEIYNLGESWISTTRCEGYTCKLIAAEEVEDAYVAIIVTKLCATFQLRPGCSIAPEDLSLMFPKCCPLLVCVGDEVLNIVESLDGGIDVGPTAVPEYTVKVPKPIRLTPEDVPRDMDVDDYLEQIRFQKIKKKKLLQKNRRLYNHINRQTFD